MPPLGRTAFWETCERLGYLMADSTNFSHLCLDGVNRVSNSNGRLRVPLKDEAKFLQLCEQALQGGTVLCLHMQRSEPLSPYFIDIDWKLFAVAEDNGDDVVCNKLYSLMQRVLMPPTVAAESKLDGWLAHVGLPSVIAQRFPQLKDARDVFEALNANPQTQSQVQGQDELPVALVDLFKTHDYPACQNWLNCNIAVALAAIAQDVLRKYYPDQQAGEDIFSCFAFHNYTEEPESEPKIGVHLHFNLVMYAANARDISHGLDDVLKREYNLGGVVDFGVHNLGIRMPFSCKPVKGPTGKRQRLLDVEGRVVVTRRYYKPSAFMDAKHSMPDVTSLVGKQFLQSILTALQAASVRTTAETPTPGFNNAGLPCAEHAPPKQETGKERFDKMELTAPRRAIVNKLVLAEPSAAKQDALYGQWARYLEALGPEGISRTIRAVPIPLSERAGQHACSAFPDMFGLVFSPVFRGAQITGLIYWPSGVKANNMHEALLVFTDATACFNRSATGMTPAMHSGDHAHSWFLLDNVDKTITQRCNNPQAHGPGHQRAAKMSCKEWPGCTRHIASVKSDVGSKVREMFDRIFALLASARPDDLLAAH